MAILDNFADNAYMVQADVDRKSGSRSEIYVRYADPNNGYMVLMTSSGSVKLQKLVRGKLSTIATNTYTPATPNALKVKLNGTAITVWIDGTQKINTTDSDILAGGVAFGGSSPKFDNLKVGYDNNADDDIDDAGDDLAVNETFASTSTTFTYCDAGNLIDDGTFVYVAGRRQRY